MKVLQFLWISYWFPSLTICEYVPLNSLTIESLYSKKSDEETTSTTLKPWWEDLQEQREQIKAAKIRAQQLNFENGKIINRKRPEEAAKTTRFVTEVPGLITSPLPYKEQDENWPQGKLKPKNIQVKITGLKS